MAEEAESGLKERFKKKIDSIAEYNQLKILHAMQKTGKRGTPGNLYRIWL